jgi:NADPH-dependent curcumin reductase CurA
MNTLNSLSNNSRAKHRVRKGSGDYLKAGKLKNKAAVVKGIDKTVAAFIGLFQRQTPARWWWS